MSEEHNNDENRYVHLEGGVPIFTPALEDPDPEKRADREAENSYKEEQLALQRRMLWTQIGLVVFGLASLGIGAWQANVAQQNADISDKAVLLAQKSERDSRAQSEAALKQGRDQFIQDQRPYIAETTNSVGPPTFHPTHDGLGQILWDYHITNYGKSPAISVRERRFIRIGDGSYVESYSSGLKIHRVSTTMAPTAETMSTVVSKPMTAADFQKLIQQKVGDPISAKVIITYQDFNGNPYETDICLSYNASFAIRFCEGNSIK